MKYQKLLLPLVILLTFTFLTQSALADKPSWAGTKGNSSKNNKKDKAYKSSGSSYSGSVSLSIYFNDEQRRVIRNYYRSEYHKGHCPPGLAKKNNGCMPPGQAKKWKMGKPLPSDVIYYDLPTTLVAQIGKPPKGNKYVRVANDILLIAVGTGLIVDAIQDISSL